MNENPPNPRTATPEDSSWGYDMFCGWKQAWLSLGASIKLRPKKKNCCIGVTRPTLILPPTLDIFIYLFIFFEEKK